MGVSALGATLPTPLYVLYQKQFHILQTHKDTGFIILGLTTVLVVWSFFQNGNRAKGAWAFLGLALISAYLVTPR